jgi:lysophospholipase L1-like esterase
VVNLCRFPLVKSWVVILAAVFGFLSPAKAHRLLVFGDSVTAPRAKIKVYVDVLSDALLFEEEKIEVINAGVPGNTTVQALKRLESDVLQKRPDTAVLLFGINDAAVDVWKNPPATQPRTSLEAYRANLKTCVAALKTLGVRVVLMTPSPVYWSETTLKLYGKTPYAPEDPDGFNVLLRTYAVAVREVAREENVTLVDVFEAFKRHPAIQAGQASRLLPDGMHPNSEGQEVIAEALLSSLCALDSRYTRAAKTVWIPSGEVNKVHPLARDITHDTPYPCVLGPALVSLGGGGVMSVFSTPSSYQGKPGECFIGSRVTRDGGKAWDPVRELVRLPAGRAAHPTVLRTHDGTLHLFFLGFVKFEWDKEHRNPTAACRSDLWTSRSRDDGFSWSDPQLIFEGYTGATNGAVQTRDGRIVVPFSHYVSNPGRLVAKTVGSVDGGKSWDASNALDIGGAGDHEGALEPCVVELRDGRCWMLIRTTRKVFWESFSNDGGRSWTPAQASSIDSTSAPAHVVRLRDGSLAMAWNRAEGGRKLLHVALSGDEGKKWTPSLVVARGSATYPFLLEPEPGELWIGYMDAHTGWNTPRARHMRIPQKVVLEAATGTHP